MFHLNGSKNSLKNTEVIVQNKVTHFYGSRCR